MRGGAAQCGIASRLDACRVEAVRKSGAGCAVWEPIAGAEAAHKNTQFFATGSDFNLNRFGDRSCMPQSPLSC